ncbi:hypothetical protein [Klebsiella aerogenes]|uniref:hypothetical protein n=1 Tax=Klebsiella aerogenes TaxID=548 RepID=UPI001CC41D84|nr:hypothetical protein [Klebsiella aerogenes]
MKVPSSFSLYLKKLTLEQLTELLEWNGRDKNANKHVNKEIEREIADRESSKTNTEMV